MHEEAPVARLMVDHQLTSAAIVEHKIQTGCGQGECAPEGRTSSRTETSVEAVLGP